MQSFKNDILYTFLPELFHLMTTNRQETSLQPHDSTRFNALLSKHAVNRHDNIGSSAISAHTNIGGCGIVLCAHVVQLCEL